MQGVGRAALLAKILNWAIISCLVQLLVPSASCVVAASAQPLSPSPHGLPPSVSLSLLIPQTPVV